MTKIQKAVADLRRTSGKYSTPAERGAALLAAANADDLLENLERAILNVKAAYEAAILYYS